MDPSELSKMLAVKPAPERNWARYAVCPQCKRIMSGKVKKLKQITEDIWIHLSCYQAFVNQALKNAKKKVDEKAQA